MTYSVTRFSAIQALRPGAVFKIENGVLEWLDTIQAPPNPWEIDDKVVALTKDLMWEKIKAFRDSRQDGGNLVNGKWFHSDSKSRIQQLALVNMATANQIPPNLMWKTMDGSFVQMTNALAYAIFFATAMSDQTIFTIAEQHRAAMNASSDPGSYDYTVNWPQIYSDIVPPVVLPPPVFNGGITPEMLVNTDVVPDNTVTNDPPPEQVVLKLPTPAVQ